MTRSYLPMVISIAVIIAVTVLQERSKTVAALTATMPLTVALALWMVFSTNPGAADRIAFAGGMVLGIGPTVGFLVAAWLATRAGWSIWGVIGSGYATWATLLLLATGVRRWAGS